MLTCREVIRVLIDYLEGDLSADERQGLEEHMAGCGACYAFMRTYQKSTELVRAALQPDDVPEELSARVRRFLKAKLGLSR